MKIIISIVIFLVAILSLFLYWLKHTSNIAKEVNLSSNRIVFNEVFYIEDPHDQNQDEANCLILVPPRDYALSSNDISLNQIKIKWPSVVRRIEIGEVAIITSILRRDSAWSGVYEYLIIEINSDKFGKEKIKVGMRHFFTQAGKRYVKTNAFSYLP